MAREELISKISESIKNVSKKPALIPFIVSGFPDMEITKILLKLFDKKGVAAVELGIPYSDPLADGPIIQQASKISLENKTNPDEIFKMLGEIKNTISIPVILFTYYNPVLQYGVENFIKKSRESRVSGLIIPDIPLEESEEILDLCKKYDIDFIMLISPTSGKDRIKKISQKSLGFVYLVSSVGVTGTRESFSASLENLVKEIKSCTKVPIAVGFGVSNAEHLDLIKKTGAEAAVIGSALIKIISGCQNNQSSIPDKVSEYLDSLLAK
jgi:tryptophan synthase alpha chain